MYLSESLTKIAYKKPDKTKLEVLSGRESGSNGFGFNFPSFINFYNDNVNVFITQFSPRGYVSPIADGAFNFYKFKYLGTFYEDGKAINKIQVIPKRKFEPLFFGTINITEERKKQVDFTAPYYAATGEFIGAKNINLEISPEGLKPRIVVPPAIAANGSNPNVLTS